ncbi:MAG: adenylate/guanylate cyclase domain-containing protein, partial [Anaerolineae bacterium]
LHAGEAWWQQAAAPNRAGIGVTDPTFDPQGDGLTLTIALPIVEPNSKAVVGVLRARLSLQEVEGIIARRALGSEATIQMTDETSRLLIVAVPEGTLQHSTQTVTLTDQATRQAAAAAPGPVNAGFLIVEAGDETQIIGYAHTAAGDFYDQPAGLVNFSGFGWGITIAQSERIAAQVLQPLNEAVAAFAGLPALLRTVILLTLVAAAVLSLGSALWFATRITRPLIALSNMAQQVQEGDLQVQTEARSNDEVGLLAQTFNAMTAGLRERERERDIFGRVVSPEVREKLLSGELSLGGETRWVAVLFSDIRGFSTISEQMTPQEVVTMLNEYMTEMSAAIRPWGGYINNFIGDAIIAVFGAPLDQGDKEWRAVAAGLDMQRRLVMLNRRRQARGEIVLHSGIGISTGEAVAGQIGSLERLLYTVIGDAVNVAQRLETLTKEYSYNILINAATAQAIRHRAGVQLDSIGTVTLKGRTEPLEVFGVQAV